MRYKRVLLNVNLMVSLMKDRPRAVRAISHFLPEDTEIIAIYPHPMRMGYVEVILESSSWPGLELNEIIPELMELPSFGTFNFWENR